VGSVRRRRRIGLQLPTPPAVEGHIYMYSLMRRRRTLPPPPPHPPLIFLARVMEETIQVS